MKLLPACRAINGDRACILPAGHDGPHDAHGFFWTGVASRHALCPELHPTTGFGCARPYGHVDAHGYDTVHGRESWIINHSTIRNVP